jgi:Cu(I)/Ag(I) efflux system membrane fusion protein
MRTLLLVVLIVVAFTVGYFFRGERPEPQKHEHAAEERVKKVIWTCSMHSQIQLPKPGQCPICGMDLIPVSNEGSGDEGNPPELTMSEKAVKMTKLVLPTLLPGYLGGLTVSM